MAERTHTFASGDRWSASYVYDDVEGKPLRIIVVNDDPTRTLHARIERTTSGWHREGSWGPNTGETVINIPPGQREQFALVPDGGDPSRDDYYSTLGDLTTSAWMTDG